MRRFWLLAAAVLLLTGLAVSVCASESGLVLSDATVQPGQTVYMTVSLEESVSGDTIGISYDYDAQLLKVIPSQCVWKKKGLLKDFSTESQEGVWAAQETADLKGDICLLVFRVLSEEPFENSPVTCELVVKDGPTEVARYQAAANVCVVCPHSYGGWEGNGEQLHTRICSLCDARQSESHSWGEASMREDPRDSSREQKVTPCTVCGWEKIEQIQSAVQEILPTAPTVTIPTEPEYTLPVLPTEAYPEDAHQVSKPTNPTAPTHPDGSGKPNGSAGTSEPTESTAPTHSSQNGQNNTDPEVTQPSVYQPYDYNAPQETEESGVTDTDPHTHEENTGDTTAATAVKEKKKFSFSGEKKATAAKPQQQNRGETADSRDEAQPQENRSNTGVWIIAAVSAGAMVALEWIRRKKSSH